MSYPGYKQPSGFEVGPPKKAAPAPTAVSPPFSRHSGEATAGGGQQCASDHSTAVSSQSAQSAYVTAKKEAKKAARPSE